MKIFLTNPKISLRLKILIPFLLIVIVMMLTVTYTITIRELRLRREQVTLRMEQLAKNIATIRSVETEDWDVYRSYSNTQLQLNQEIIYIAIFDEQGELKVHALNTEWLDLGTQQTFTQLEQTNIIMRLEQRQLADESQKDLESKSVNILIGDQNMGTVKVGFSLIELNDEMRNNLIQNLTLAIIFTLLAMAISFYISSKIVNPISKLTEAMLHISKGDLGQQVEIDSHDEIGEMAQTFNFMSRGLQEKEVIESFARELGFTVELNRIVRLITKRIAFALNSKKAFFFLRDQKDGETFDLVCTYPRSQGLEVSLRRDEPVCRFFKENPNTLSLTQLSDFPRVVETFSSFIEFRSNSLICPLIIKDKVLGVLLLGTTKNGIPYSDEQKSFLNTLVRQGGFAIESALLYEELTEKQRLKRELEIAASIQNSLLPQANPPMPGLDIDGICLPAEEVGGDYYDYFMIDDHTIGIAIADVTGKGTFAAFYMAVVKGMMLSLAPIIASPKELLQELNKRLYGNLNRKTFVTMIYATFDVKEHVLKFARAGHNSLLMRKAGQIKVDLLTPYGMGLGLEKGEKFDKTICEQKIIYTSGDVFLFYTDGISEAMNLNMEEFSEKQLVDILSRSAHSSASQIRMNVIQSIRQFVQKQAQHDDITMVIIKAT